MSNLENFSSGTTVLRGNFIHNFIERASRALEQLDFPDEAHAISQIYFGRLKKVTLHDLYWHCCKPVLTEIARRRGFDFDLNTWWKDHEHNKRKSIKSPVHLARNFYIFQKVGLFDFNQQLLIFKVSLKTTTLGMFYQVLQQFLNILGFISNLVIF